MAEKGNTTETIIREVPVDRGTAIKLRKIAARAEERKHRVILLKARNDAREAARADRFHASLEIQKLRVQMSAREAASKHIAVFGPIYLLLLIAAFLFSINYIPESQISVVASLLTLLVTGLMSNLRSIISEGNGHEEEVTAPKQKQKKD